MFPYALVVEDPTISDAISTASSGFTDQLWLVAPIGLAVFAVIWGLPKAVGFFKRLAK